MMDIMEALRAFLLADAGVAGLVGERVFVTEAPQDAALPLVVLKRVSTPRVYAQTGPSGLAWPRVQITARAARQAEAVAVAKAVRTAVNGYRGSMGDVPVQAVFVDTERDGFLFDTDKFERVQDAIVWHAED